MRTSVRLVSLSTNRKGAIAETAITAEATRLGIDVYRPVSDGGRFDLIFGFEYSLARVQCKWANLVKGVVPVSLVAGRRVIHLRVAPAANNQNLAINWAEQYELGAIAQLGERSAGSRKVGGSNPPSSTSNVRPLR
jgi:hypothetical protein